MEVTLGLEELWSNTSLSLSSSQVLAAVPPWPNRYLPMSPLPQYEARIVKTWH